MKTWGQNTYAIKKEYKVHLFTQYKMAGISIRAQSEKQKNYTSYVDS